MDLPQYFPTDWNRRLAGLQDPFRKKFSVVFQDFGRCGHVDVKFSDSSQSSGQPVFTAQRQHNKHRDRARLCAQTPTLPLSDTPVKGWTWSLLFFFFFLIASPSPSPSPPPPPPPHPVSLSLPSSNLRTILYQTGLPRPRKDI